MQDDDTKSQLYSVFNKQLQDEYARLHVKNQQDLQNPHSTNGTTVYLICSKWMDQFKQTFFPNWVPNSTSSKQQLPPLTNTEVALTRQQAQDMGILLCNSQDCQFNHLIKQGCFPNIDFEPITKQMWQILCVCFSEQPPIPVVRSFERIGLGIRTQIEYFYQLFECQFVSIEGYKFNQSKFYFSSKKTVNDLKQRILVLVRDQLQLQKISPNRVRVYQQAQDLISLENVGHCLVQHVIYKQNKLTVDICNSDGVFMINQPTAQPSIYSKCNYCQKQADGDLGFSCKWCNKVSYCSQLCMETDELFHDETCFGFDNIKEWDKICQPKLDARMGLTGIRNINNSCYLSSSLQCLSHVVALSNYFLQGQFKKELNLTNPLGTQGKLAIGYAKLIKSLWMDEKDSVAPFHIKDIVGKFKKQFNNQEQQDSQELLSVLLDGLHEDLNRVKHKPLVPMIESDGSDDMRASQESWLNHLKRNQSIIVDLMHGLYKSTVQCPDCNKVSVTFEPYMNISLPIPEIKMIQKQFFWVPSMTNQRSILHTFNVKSHKLVKHVKSQIAEFFQSKRKNIELVLVQDDQVRRILPNDELISKINHPLYGQTTVLAIEVPKNRELDVWCNFQIVEDCKNESQFQQIFPRMLNLQLEQNLIQAHLDVFKMMRPLFLSYLETRERINQDERDWKALKKMKGIFGIPPMMTSEKWKTMSVIEQYTSVFGPQDPSRRKLEDLPYFVKIVSRVSNGICVYCKRTQCTGCPLRFDDKQSLKEMLNLTGVPTKAEFHYQEQRPQIQIKKNNKQKKKQTRNQANRQSSFTEELELPKSPEFELIIQINPKRCWALFSMLNRYVHFADSKYKSNDLREDTDNVSIHDCFRQFHKPENLSQANAWYCNKCVQHKQAMKKIQLYNVPPVLIINFKRFRGNYAKQNMFIEFPTQGLDMSEYVVSQLQDTPIYDLFAVSNHFGQLHSGHYTAITRNRNNWYQFNDHKISTIDERDIVSSSAYILFYQRRGVNFNKLDYTKIQNTASSALLEQDCKQETGGT